MSIKKALSTASLLFMFMLVALPVFAGEADIVLPDLSIRFIHSFRRHERSFSIMYFGLVICFVGLDLLNHPGKPDEEHACT